MQILQTQSGTDRQSGALGAGPADVRARLARLHESSPAERAALREYLLEQLTAPAMLMRAVAAEGLGRVGDERAIGPLIQALRDPAALVQWRAAHALHMLHARALVAPDRLVFQEGLPFEQW